MDDIKLTSISDTVFTFYRIALDGFDIAYLNTEPFGNCQTMSIAFMANILDRGDTVAKKVLKECLIKGKKTQLLVDMSANKISMVEDLFGTSSIKFKTPYINNTGSNMCLMMIETDVINTW